MIRKLSLTNFKPFGNRQDIPVAPLTLIFGVNSSGKSSIIQSLLLGQHACETGVFDASHLPVTPDGDFAAPWPGGFFAERLEDLP
jgi:AAA15 family ATPase/GTPase